MLKDLSAQLAEYQDNVKGVEGQYQGTTRGKLEHPTHKGIRDCTLQNKDNLENEGNLQKACALKQGEDLK